MLARLKRKFQTRGPQAAPSFALRAMEPRLLLSADPITGVFEGSVNADLPDLEPIEVATQELADSLDKLAQEQQAEKNAPQTVYTKPINTFSLLVSTAKDVKNEIGQAGGSDGWKDNDAVSASNLSFGPAGSESALFEEQFLISDFSDDGKAKFNGLHYVTSDILVGTANGMTLLQGDIVFTLGSNKDVTGTDGQTVNVQHGDIAVFRPDTPGDYSSGHFFTLVDKAAGSNKHINALTLVEQDTSIAGHTLLAGELIIAVEGNDHKEALQRVNVTDAGESSDVTLTELISDNSGSSTWNISTAGVNGLELIETDQTIGGVSFSAGTLLVASDDDAALLSLSFSGSATNLEYNDATTTSLWSYDVALEGEGELDAVTLVTSTTYVNVEPTGTVTIDGTATEDQTLSANTSGLADEDGLGTFAYQWLRDGSAITGATSADYTLTDADVDAQLSVRVSYTDGYGTDEQITSAATASVANINDAPTGSVTISGSAEENQLLSANTTTLADADGLGNLNYQWLRDGSAIAGANAATYTLGDNDVGAAIALQVGYTDGHGSAELVTSSATAGVANINDAPGGTVTITGSAQEDQTLSADTTGLSDADGLGTFSYQWLRDGSAIVGANAATYTLDDADVGTAIALQVSYTDGHGSAEQVTSGATASVANINDLPTGNVSVLGTAVSGQTLSLDLSALTDADGLGTLSYQWLRDGVAVVGATNAGFTLTDTDIGAVMSAQISYTDDQGSAELVTSLTSAAVVDNVTTDIASASISGTAEQGQTLVAQEDLQDEFGGTLVASNLQYQWFRDGVAIAGATGANYLLSNSDVASAISVLIQLDNPSGDTLSALSTATAAVANTNDLPTGAITLGGTTQEDQTLTADTSDLADIDGLGAFSYQWLRDGSAITGATGSAYTLDDADVGHQISLQVNYTDGQGTLEQVTSGNTAAIANINDLATGSVVISGTEQEDQTLTADTSGLADNDGLGVFSYQWLRNGGAIAGATGITYALGDDDVGANISVQVNYTDGFGAGEQITSGMTGAIANVNDAVAGAVAIFGTAQEDQILTADTSGLTDPDGLGSFTYQWLRNGSAINGATALTYQLTDTDVGASLAVAVGYVDDFGELEQTTSAATDAVSNINDAPTGGVTLSGSVQEDQTLTAMTDTLADSDGLGVLSYQWLRDGVAIDGAQAQQYTLGDDDVGASLTALVRYVDGYGTGEQILSHSSEIVSNVNDLPSGTLAIIGNTQEDQTLTADTSALADADGLGAFTYQWLRDGQAISGATGASYALGDADVGTRIGLQAHYIDAQGTAEQVQSQTTTPVANVNDLPSGAITIEGTFQEDQTLTADTRDLGDIDGLGDVSYQWLRDGEVIDGAIEQRYTLGDNDAGAQIAVRISYTDGQGTLEQITSPTGAPIANINDLPGGGVAITGNPLVGEVIRANTDDLMDADGLGSFQYQWLRDGEAIEGATDASYRLVGDDRDKNVTVVVRYIDGFGQAEQMLSQAVVARELILDLPSVALDSTALDSDTATVTPPLVTESQSQDQTDTEQPAETNDQASTEGQSDATDPRPTGPSPSLPDGTIDFTGLPLGQLDTALGEQAQPEADNPTIALTKKSLSTLFSEPTTVAAQAETVANLDHFLDPLVLVNNAALNDSFDQLRQQFLTLSDNDQLMLSGTTTVTASFSLGYAIWLLRSGVLLSTALSALPAWRFIDPLPVLMSGGGNDNGDGESLQSMVSQGTQQPATQPSVDSSETQTHRP